MLAVWNQRLKLLVSSGLKQHSAHRGHTNQGKADGHQRRLTYIKWHLPLGPISWWPPHQRCSLPVHTGTHRFSFTPISFLRHIPRIPPTHLRFHAVRYASTSADVLTATSTGQSLLGWGASQPGRASCWSSHRSYSDTLQARTRSSGRRWPRARPARRSERQPPAPQAHTEAPHTTHLRHPHRPATVTRRRAQGARALSPRMRTASLPRRVRLHHPAWGRREPPRGCPAPRLSRSRLAAGLRAAPRRPAWRVPEPERASAGGECRAWRRRRRRERGVRRPRGQPRFLLRPRWRGTRREWHWGSRTSPGRTSPPWCGPRGGRPPGAGGPRGVVRRVKRSAPLHGAAAAAVRAGSRAGGGAGVAAAARRGRAPAGAGWVGGCGLSASGESWAEYGGLRVAGRPGVPRAPAVVNRAMRLRSGPAVRAALRARVGRVCCAELSGKAPVLRVTERFELERTL